jgi:hypothetical protein
MSYHDLKPSTTEPGGGRLVDQLGGIERKRRNSIMKALEFQAQLNSDGSLAIPASLLSTVPVGQTVRVIVLVPENEADQEWEQLAAEEFGKGYAESDALYDQIPGRGSRAR